MTTQVQMLMCHKVTHKNLIDSSPLFRYYLTHTPCNFSLSLLTLILEEIYIVAT
mgnify:CR=1 FL=1